MPRNLQFVMAACELEDGEILDSDSDNETSSNIPVKAASTISQGYRNPVNSASYRVTSDVKRTSSSDESDEEQFTWKKKKYNEASKEHQKSMEYNFSNCLSKNSTHQTTNPAQFSFGQNIPTSNPIAAKPKKSQNIWGSVLQSQMLSQGFRGFDMEQKEECYVERQVESYCFKNALKDDRPWPVEAVVDSEMTSKKSDEPFDNVPDLEKLEEDFIGVHRKAEKRRRSAKKRLGKAQHAKQTTKDNFDVTAEDDEETVTEAIANALEESKVYLIEKVVHVLGKKKALEIACLTRDVEEHGGMMTNNGGRRRTPGGVFFQLLKTDSQVSKQNMKDIFNDEKKEKAKTKKILRAKRFKNKLKKRLEAEMGSYENANMETVGEEQTEERLNVAVSEDSNSNSKDSFSQSNSSAASSDTANMDMSELLKRHREFQSERKPTADGCDPEEKLDTDSMKDQPPVPSEKQGKKPGTDSVKNQPPTPSEKRGKRPDAVIYLDEDIDMTFDI